ncbi:hypothetical protein NLU13_6742 [Sarocladium strictum]|uniref:Carboxylic ester hydrolase n=1 Tax=Sarocladium strictum TaxID=5046 RepID=A0AA39L639_SARSR|nr:hypothetical protein NLU13_6742 [Sarocladium strictum]
MVGCASPGEASLPVLLWIHGGSQAVSFGNSATGLCEPTRLVKRSVETSQPIIVVTINYRLNIFAFGDLESDRNLALKDQQRAIEFVRAHIAGFGGDPNRITIAGESAGAVFCHALLVMGSPVDSCILQSGTLGLSPPQPRPVAENLINRLSDDLQAHGENDLRSAAVPVLLAAQDRLGMHSFYLQDDESLQGWKNAPFCERLLIGDTEFEAVLWRNGIESCAPAIICDAFAILGPESQRVKGLYGIVPDRPVSCKLGALDFLNDVRFSLPIERALLLQRGHKEDSKVFRYVLDQPNPWQASSRAHHGVDLVYLFGGYDMSHSKPAQEVSRVMQDKWIEFISGRDPWSPGSAFAFGPFGVCAPLDAEQLAVRRRNDHLVALAGMGDAVLEQAVGQLGRGRSSLFN